MLVVKGRSNQLPLGGLNRDTVTKEKRVEFETLPRSV